MDSVNATCKVKVNNDWMDSFTDCWILKYYIVLKHLFVKEKLQFPEFPDNTCTLYNKTDMTQYLCICHFICAVNTS